MMPLQPRTIFMRYVSAWDTDPSLCWLWTGSCDKNGYGKFNSRTAPGSVRRSQYAHRFAWELSNGRKIPEGLVIDHLCNVRKCVNPHHLELVTINENSRRGHRTLHTPASFRAQRSAYAKARRQSSRLSPGQGSLW